MITQLRFKNWRSLKDVTIDDLGKITVFIGANSSGKTNIIDALDFRRDSLLKGLVSTVQDMGYIKIQTDALHNDEAVELIYGYRLESIQSEIIEEIGLRFDKRDVPFQYRKQLFENNVLLEKENFRELPVRDVFESGSSYWAETEEGRRIERARELSSKLYRLILKRWQILGDNFNPPLSLSRNQSGDLYTIERDGGNTLRILELMMNAHLDLYERLQEDLHYILDHVSKLRILRQQQTGEIRLRIDETSGKTAPTISAGTARLTAILTAIYALDMPQQASNFNDNEVLTAADPGLVVIEEPDMGLNPGVLRRFVEQLRNYVDGPNPRQIIMTTHNPAFLDYFEPEEVRVVERNEEGYTIVNKIPDYIKEIWLKDGEYGLGEVWTTRSFGGVPE
ncbi:MAG: AAA family ATPase [Chloroflexi bacterium]|nr:AAA family ATPase [Chloroflexota bacterium]MCC6896846.1 AAA family ATPase [Anaerolineae bacterium]